MHSPLKCKAKCTTGLSCAQTFQFEIKLFKLFQKTLKDNNNKKDKTKKQFKETKGVFFHSLSATALLLRGEDADISGSFVKDFLCTALKISVVESSLVLALMVTQVRAAGEIVPSHIPSWHSPFTPLAVCCKLIKLNLACSKVLEAAAFMHQAVCPSRVIVSLSVIIRQE